MELKIKVNVSGQPEALADVEEVTKAINALPIEYKPKFIIQIMNGISFEDYHKIPADEKEKINKSFMTIYNDWNGINAGSGN